MKLILDIKATLSATSSKRSKLMVTADLDAFQRSLILSFIRHLFGSVSYSCGTRLHGLNSSFPPNGMVELKEKRMAMSGQAGIHSTTKPAALPREHKGIIVTTQLSPGEHRDQIHCLSSTTRGGRKKTALRSFMKHCRGSGPTGKTVPRVLNHVFSHIAFLKKHEHSSMNLLILEMYF